MRAAVFYPSGGLLDTGLWTAQRNRPPELARAKEHTPGPVATFEQFRERLAAMGRNAAQIVAAMDEFRAGKRAATIMDRVAKGFTEDEVKAIAAWFAAQKD